MDKIPIEVSARHVHLSKNDLEKLFGSDYELKVFKQLTQPSDFAAKETVDISVGGKTIKSVRVVGPLRQKTQIEISKTDSFSLGVNPPIRLSGDLDESLGVKLIGPKGEVDLSEGLIVAKRHLHCATSEASELGIKNGDRVSVEVNSTRPVVFNEVLVRVRDDYSLCLHLDTDEGNAAGLDRTGKGVIVK